MKTAPLSHIHTIAKSSKPDVDILVRVQSSVLGQLYQRYVKQSPILRNIIVWTWSCVYLLYVKYSCIFEKDKQWRALHKQSDYSTINGLETYKLVDAELVRSCIPLTFPINEQKYLLPNNYQYQIPEITMIVLKNTMIYGGTNLILLEDGAVLCHDLYNFETDYTSEELHGQTCIDPKSQRIRWLLHDKTPEYISVAATFLDACALNYAHWLTEVLPRIAVFCADKRFSNIPIIVNEGLHGNILKSLLAIANNERDIVLCPIGRALCVEKLYVTSPTGYVPFERRKKNAIVHSHGLFSAQAFELLRYKIDQYLNNIEVKKWPEKIILRRNAQLRCLKNAPELEIVLIEKGFVVVEPEHLTFIEQVQLFKNAKIIVATTGAALATAIFCTPGTNVIVLMAKHRNMIYRYWCNILSPIKVCVTYVLCDLVKKHSNMHGDFLVNIDEVLNALNIVEAK